MTGFPLNPPNAPIGKVAGVPIILDPEWYRFFRAIQSRVGGPEAPWDDSSLLTASIPDPPRQQAEAAVDLAPPAPVYDLVDPLVPPAHVLEIVDFLPPPAAPFPEVTDFIRTLLNDPDAASARATLGISGNLALVSDSASAIVFSFAIGGTTYYLQAGTGTLTANSAGTITYPQAYATRAFCIVSGGDSDTSREGDIVAYSVSTTAASIKNSSAGNGTFWWVAIGY